MMVREAGTLDAPPFSLFLFSLSLFPFLWRRDRQDAGEFEGECELYSPLSSSFLSFFFAGRSGDSADAIESRKDLPPSFPEFLSPLGIATNLMGEKRSRISPPSHLPLPTPCVADWQAE